MIAVTAMYLTNKHFQEFGQFKAMPMAKVPCYWFTCIFVPVYKTRSVPSGKHSKLIKGKGANCHIFLLFRKYGKLFEGDLT